ncbi:MAG TPA: PilZ domain-containing protein [Allosphingosinicella sp.]|nr:PilZ domain-containing protein [Allosphingosinicella sp.]
MQMGREQRRKVLLRARMRADGAPTDVCVRDVSSRGLLVQAAAPPPRGTYVELDCAGQLIVGRIIWRKDRRFGIQSRDRIDVRALAGGPAAEAPPRPRPRPAFAAVRAKDGGSRILAGAIEYAVIAAFAAALVAAVGLAVFETLSRPFENVAAHLGG